MQKTRSAAFKAVAGSRLLSHILTLVWLVGILCGCVAGHFSRGVCGTVVSSSASCVPSLFGSVCAAVLPFLLSAFIISFGEPWLLLIFSAFKAFSFSFCAWGVCLAFGQSSWLVLFLFLFSDLLLLPMLYLYWLRHIGGEKNSPLDLGLVLLFPVLVGCLDHFIIAPFLASVLN